MNVATLMNYWFGKPVSLYWTDPDLVVEENALMLILEMMIPRKKMVYSQAGQ
jgi:hypothetical protein